MNLNKADRELVKIATKVVVENGNIYSPIDQHVGCALRAKSGKVYIGMNIKTSHSICAEQVAIGQAYANGEREFDAIVAVRLNKDGKPYVVSPCGLCRYTFKKLKLDMYVIVPESEKKNIKVKAKDLLPYA